MSQTQGTRIPRHVNELTQIGPFEIDELIVLLIVLFIGIMSGHIFKGILLSIGATYFFSYFKSKSSRGVMVHMLYYYGVIDFKNLWCDNVFAKYWIK